MNQDIAVEIPKKSRRILAFDLIRGYFLAMILIDHIELYPNGWDFFTGKGRLFVSAAEGFFFMSGLLIGIVYRRRLQFGLGFIFKKLWRRAAELYIGAVFFTLFYTAAAIFLNHTSIKDGIYNVVDWGQIIRQTLLGHYVYGWADFLIHFAILTALAPFGFFLLAKRKWWLLLAISFVGWIFRGQDFIMAWQIVFSLGMIIGYHWYQIEEFWRSIPTPNQRQIRRFIFGVTIATFVLSYASVYLLSTLNHYWNSSPHFLQTFTGQWNNFNAWIWQFTQKWTMGPLRIILFLLWFTSLFALVQRYEKRINETTRNVFELLGRNSLFVYIVHSVIVFGFKLFIPPNTNFISNFLISGAALFLLIAVVVAYKRLSAPAELPIYFQKALRIAAK